MKDKYVKFNMNNRVKVKLTDKGKTIFSELDKKVDKHIVDIIGQNVYSSRISEKGYVVMQMWEFIEVFGQYMYLGVDLPVEMDIILRSEDVKEEL
jgi:hypothetical protein